VSTDYNALLARLIREATSDALTGPTAISETGESDRAQLVHLLVLALKSPHHWTEARDLLMHLNPTFEKDGRYSEWAELLEQALARSLSAADAETTAILQLYLGNIYRVQGQADAGLELFYGALAYFENHGPTLWYARTCNALARLLQEQGEMEVAMRWAKRALEILPWEQYAERGVSYRMLGGVAVRRHEWETAYDYLSECLRLYRLDGDPRLIAFGLTNVSAPLRGLGRYTETETALQEAMQLFDEVGDEPHLGIAHIALGNLYLARKQWQSAIGQYHNAARIFEPRGDILRLAGVYNGWGMAYAGEREWDRAIRTFKHSIEYWRQNGNRDQQANVMDNLAMAYLSIGDAAAAAATCREGLVVLGEIDNEVIHNDLSTHLAEAEAELHALGSG
jgi:tetratricopeptide (TPR) repeat protein